MSEEDKKSKEEIDSTPRWTHTLSGGFSIHTYGVIEYLRIHPFLRWIVGFFGVAACIGAAAAAGGFKIPGFSVAIMPLMIAGPWLIYVSTLSGKHFRVIFPPIKASEEREKAEKQFEKTNTIDDALKLDFTRLNEYYAINQNQARSSFRWAIFSMILGLGTIIAGIWIFYFRKNHPDILMASLSTAAGCIVNLISALFLHLHSKIQAHSLHYFDQLSRLQNLSIAIRLVDEHPDQQVKQEARNLVIRELILGVQTGVVHPTT